MKPSNIVALFAVVLVIGIAYLFFYAPDWKQKGVRSTFEAKSPDSRLMAVQAVTLKNGLQIVVIPDRNSRDTIHMVWYKVGSVDDPFGKPGLAHLVEHLTSGGTHKTPASQFHQILEKTAKKQDAITTRDYTVYYQIAAPEQLATFMALEADRMSNVAFYETSMASESKALLDERRQKDWRSMFDQGMDAALYGNHPYGSSESNRGEKIDGIQDAVGFYRKWYAPNNAIVLVSGKVTAEDIFKLAEEHYGGIPSRPIPIRRIVAVKQPAHPQNVVLEDSRARDPIWRRSYLAPSYVAGATEYVYALQVLDSLLASGPGSRLHERLVRGKALAKEIAIDYVPDSLSFPLFSIDVVLKPGASFSEIAREIDLDLEQLAVTPPTPEELARALRNTQPNTDLHGENIPGAAQLVGSALARGRKLEEVSAWRERIRAVTPRQIQEAAKAVLVSDRSVTGVVSPRRLSPAPKERDHEQKR